MSLGGNSRMKELLEQLISCLSGKYISRAICRGKEIYGLQQELFGFLSPRSLCSPPSPSDQAGMISVVNPFVHFVLLVDIISH